MQILWIVRNGLHVVRAMSEWNTLELSIFSSIPMQCNVNDVKCNVNVMDVMLVVICY